MNKTIFITGANGLVGAAACKYFTSQKYHVVALVRDINYKTQSHILEKCSVVRGDILDKELIRSILSKYECDLVLHLASQPIVRICHNDPYTCYETNIMGCLNILEAVRNLKKKPDKVVIMTSDKQYSNAPVPYTEETPPQIGDSYCVSKTAQDMISLSYARTYKLPIVVIRAGNLYGNDLNLSRLIPNTIIQLLQGKSPTLYTGVAENLREWIHVDDIVSAYEVLLQSGVPGEAYNCGGTYPVKVIDIITMLRDKIQPETSINIMDKDFFDIKEQYLNGDKLHALGWSPKINLSDGLDRTIKFYQKYLERTL